MMGGKFYSFKGIFSSPVSWHIRKKIFSLFMEIMNPNEYITIIDVGVGADRVHIEDNFFEKLYPFKGKIVGVGLEDASFLEEEYPGFTFIQADGTCLPFTDRAFDIAFSSAVVEHVGSREKQAQFISEVLRVSRSAFITTPYRYFPIEVHTNLPLLHFLPVNIHRRILRLVGMSFLAKEENLNFLGKHDFASLFPSRSKVSIIRLKLFHMTSNLIGVVR